MTERIYLKIRLPKGCRRDKHEVLSTGTGNMHLCYLFRSGYVVTVCLYCKHSKYKAQFKYKSTA